MKYDKDLACNKHLFNEPLQDFQSKSNSQLQTFIDYTKPLVKHSIKTAKEQGANFIPISTFFRPRPRIPAHLLDLLR